MDWKSGYRRKQRNRNDAKEDEGAERETMDVRLCIVHSARAESLLPRMARVANPTRGLRYASGAAESLGGHTA